MTKSAAGKALLFAWGVAAAALTLTPQASVIRLPALLCLWCGEYPGVDALLNVALFFPLGVGLVLLAGCLEWTFWAGLAVSAVIELLQYVVVPGRDASLNDLFSNGLGAALGAGLACRWPTLRAPLPDRARRLVIGALTVFGGVGVVVPWLLQPTMQAQPHYVQWQQQKGGFVAWRGRLERLWLNGEEVGDGARIPPDLPPWRLSAEGLRVRAETRDSASGPDGLEIAIIARLATVDREAFLLGRSRDAAVFRARMRAMDAGLREPMVALAGGFADATETRLDATLDNGRLSLSAGKRRVELRLTAGLAWTMILPRDVPFFPWMQLVNLLFLAALAFPAGYWWVLARRGDLALRLVLGGAVAAWVLGPVVLSQPVPGAWDVAGALLGAWAGCAAGARPIHETQT